MAKPNRAASNTRYEKANYDLLKLFSEETDT